MPTGEVKAAKEAVFRKKQRRNSSPPRAGSGHPGSSYSLLTRSWSLGQSPGLGPTSPLPTRASQQRGQGCSSVSWSGAQCQALNKQPSPADRSNWKMELIKRRDLKIIVGMNKKKRYSLNLI